MQQTLYRKMRLIIKKFDVSLQSKYLAAAKAFRLPYWDYFRPRDIDARFPGIKLEGQRTRFDYDFRMPDIMNVKDVMIREPPNDYLGRHSNPLYSFKFSDKQNLDRDWIKAELQVGLVHVHSSFGLPDLIMRPGLQPESYSAMSSKQAVERPQCARVK